MISASPSGVSTTCELKCGSRSFPIQHRGANVVVAFVLTLWIFTDCTNHEGSPPLTRDSSWRNTTCVMSPTFFACAKVKLSVPPRWKCLLVSSSPWVFSGKKPVSRSAPKTESDTRAPVPAPSRSPVTVSIR